MLAVFTAKGETEAHAAAVSELEVMDAEVSRQRQQARTEDPEGHRKLLRWEL